MHFCSKKGLLPFPLYVQSPRKIKLSIDFFQRKNLFLNLAFSGIMNMLLNKEKKYFECIYEAVK